MNLLTETAGPSIPRWVEIDYSHKIECPDCRWRGRCLGESCRACRGDGYITPGDVFRDYAPSDFGLRKDEDGFILMLDGSDA